jgi:hypothetical protein
MSLTSRLMCLSLDPSSGPRSTVSVRLVPSTGPEG